MVNKALVAGGAVSVATGLTLMTVIIGRSIPGQLATTTTTTTTTSTPTTTAVESGKKSCPSKGLQSCDSPLDDELNHRSFCVWNYTDYGTTVEANCLCDELCRSAGGECSAVKYTFTNEKKGCEFSREVVTGYTCALAKSVPS